MYTRRVRRLALAPLFLLPFFAALTAPLLATTIHAGDTLYVTVWNHPELSKAVAVDADGSIRVPLSGVVEVGGLDEAGAAKKITAALRPYVIYPAVNVETTVQGTTLFVTGGPVGVLKYQPGETLEAAIADAMQANPAASTQLALNDAGQSTTRSSDANASLRSRIDLHVVKVVRDNTTVGVYDTVALSAQGETGPVLEPGDKIVFRYKAIVVRVIGDVAQPGPTYLSADQTLGEAISQAGGALPTSQSNHVLLERAGETRSLALCNPAFNQPSQTGDVLTIPRAPRVDVVGRVVTPGVVALRTDSTLLSAVYTAGGPAQFADLKNVEIVHNGQKASYNIIALTHGDMSQNPILYDGDTVMVPRNHGLDITPFMNLLGGIAAGLVDTRAAVIVLDHVGASSPPPAVEITYRRWHHRRRARSEQSMPFSQACCSQPPRRYSPWPRFVSCSKTAGRFSSCSNGPGGLSGSLPSISYGRCDAKTVSISRRRSMPPIRELRVSAAFCARLPSTNCRN